MKASAEAHCSDHPTGTRDNLTDRWNKGKSFYRVFVSLPWHVARRHLLGSVQPAIGDMAAKRIRPEQTEDKREAGDHERML